MHADHSDVARPVGPADVARRLPVGELVWDDLVVASTVRDALRSLAVSAATGGLVVLIHGPAGVGKSFAARVWAESMRLDLWRVDCPRLAERHGAGLATRGLDEAFAYGDRPQAVLLFHDAELLPPDAVAALLERAARRRGPTVLESRDTAGRLATALPEAVARIRIDLPDDRLRRLHWELAVSRASPPSTPDLDLLAAIEVPGSVIDGAVRAVVLAKGDERIETSDLVAAVRRTSA